MLLQKVAIFSWAFETTIDIQKQDKDKILVWLGFMAYQPLKVI